MAAALQMPPALAGAAIHTTRPPGASPPRLPRCCHRLQLQPPNRLAPPGLLPHQQRRTASHQSCRLLEWLLMAGHPLPRPRHRCPPPQLPAQALAPRPPPRLLLAPAPGPRLECQTARQLPLLACWQLLAKRVGCRHRAQWQPPPPALLGVEAQQLVLRLQRLAQLLLQAGHLRAPEPAGPGSTSQVSCSAVVLAVWRSACCPATLPLRSHPAARGRASPSQRATAASGCPAGCCCLLASAVRLASLRWSCGLHLPCSQGAAGPASVQPPWRHQRAESASPVACHLRW